MKVVSIITGIGYGHTIRQQAIFSQLRKNYDAEIIIASYGNASEHFKHRYKILDIDGPKFPEKNSEFSVVKTIFLNLKLPYFYIKNYIKIRRMIKAFDPDVIICDFEPIGLFLGKNKPHVVIFNFDPLLYEEYKKEYKSTNWLQSKYINWIYNKAIRIKAPVVIPTFIQHESSRYNFVNPIVRKIPKESQKELLEKLNLEKQPILIMFGGSHFSTQLLYKMQKILLKFKDELFIIFTYKLVGESEENMKFLKFKDNFLEYLKASKGIITQAGHSTLSECIILKKPSLLFPIPNLIEQSLNAFYAENKNISIVEDQRDISEEELEKTLSKFISSIPDLEKNLHNIHIKPNGAQQTAEIIHNLITEEKSIL